MGYEEFAEFHSNISGENKTGAYVGRLWVASPSGDVFIEGSVQPLSGFEAQNLNVGEDNLGKMKLFTDTELKVAEQGTENKGDMIYWLEDRWEVIALRSWQNNIIPHYEYVVEYRGPVPA
jgi:hypothetical protein